MVRTLYLDLEARTIGRLSERVPALKIELRADASDRFEEPSTRGRAVLVIGVAQLENKNVRQHLELLGCPVEVVASDDVEVV